LLKPVALAFAITIGLFGADFDWNLPTGFPKPVVPSDNLMTVAKVELGRHLLYDNGCR
jgi:cytochrome c peroxidase